MYNWYPQSFTTGSFPAVQVPTPVRNFDYSSIDTHPSVLSTFSPEHEREHPDPYASLDYGSEPPQSTNTDYLYVQDTSNVRTPPSGFLPHTVPGVYEIQHPYLQARMDFDGICGGPVIRHQHDEDYDQEVGIGLHGGEKSRLNVEQVSQWEFARLGKGWTIKSVCSGLYLTIQRGGTQTQVPITTNKYPVAWHLEIDDFDPTMVRSVNRRPAMIQR
jgi:hypothetical protein